MSTEEREAWEQRMAWLESLFDRRWDGTIGRPSTWHLDGPYRQRIALMRGESFADAIDTAIRGERGNETPQARREVVDDEARNHWKEAVINELVVTHTLSAANKDDPRRAMNDLACWQQMVALDPAVSSDARALQERAMRSERERVSKLLHAIRERWCKANGADSISVAALDQIAEVIADGSYVDDGSRGEQGSKAP